MNNKTTTINILAFGIAAEKIKTNSIAVENIVNTDELRVWLNNKYPELKELNISIAVNKKIIYEKTSLHHGDEVALLPPFSGG